MDATGTNGSTGGSQSTGGTQIVLAGCSCTRPGGNHDDACSIYQSELDFDESAGYSPCTPPGFLWPLTTGLGFKEVEGYEHIYSDVVLDQYSHLLDLQIATGNVPASQPEITALPAGGLGSIRYLQPLNTEGYALIGAVVCSFSLPMLNTPQPDVRFTMGAGFNGPALPVRMAGRFAVPQGEVPNFEAIAPCFGKKHRFIWWGDYRQLSKTYLTNWLLHSGLELGAGFTPSQLEFDISSVAAGTWKVEQIHPESLWYPLVNRLVGVLKGMSRTGRVSLPQLAAMLSSPTMMQLRKKIVIAMEIMDQQVKTAKG